MRAGDYYRKQFTVFYYLWKEDWICLRNKVAELESSVSSFLKDRCNESFLILLSLASYSNMGFAFLTHSNLVTSFLLVHLICHNNVFHINKRKWIKIFFLVRNELWPHIWKYEIYKVDCPMIVIWQNWFCYSSFPALMTIKCSSAIMTISHKS